MMNEADSEQVLDVEEDHGMQESSDEEGGEGDEGSQPGGSDHQDNEVDDSVHCFTGHTGIIFANICWILVTAPHCECESLCSASYLMKATGASEVQGCCSSSERSSD